MGFVHFSPRRRRQALHAIVARCKKHRAEDVDDEMKHDSQVVRCRAGSLKDDSPAGVFVIVAFWWRGRPNRDRCVDDENDEGCTGTGAETESPAGTNATITGGSLSPFRKFTLVCRSHAT